jgi:eukaryotic-like serine/threonine-protein kinase
MSKVFTITEGLENLGALKTGGQGSIYRAKRTGPIITAVKLLPTPITSEDLSDKHYRDFQNEVEKLKKVNEMPNPNVVRILNFGISETGSFPFIEMEFIDGPDLEELLKEPHDPVFTIKETIRVAEHLANALAHCHRVDVKHGDIKSNNIKYNVHTGNYVLLDFGLAVMSDEQRRTSLRNAGAIEFMAPEQSEGHMLFQSDVYSAGIIIYELLAGQVPFPLESKNLTSRNHVLIAHRETPIPDPLQLREKNLPSNWPEERREHEMAVPQWLIDMLRKCLEKAPEARFANGVELYEYILMHSTKIAETTDLTEMLRQENKKLKEELAHLKTVEKAAPPPPPVFAQSRPTEFAQPAYTPPPPPALKRNWALPIAAATLAALALLFFIFRDNRDSQGEIVTTDTATNSFQATQPASGSQVVNEDPSTGKKDTLFVQNVPVETPTNQPPVESEPTTEESPPNEEPEAPAPQPTTRHYVVRSGQAYFHNSPDPSTRREAYLTPSDEVMTATDEQGEYVYIVFTNENGQTSKGWVRKSDLNPVE